MRQLELIETIITENVPAVIGNTVIGNKANPPPGEGWVIARYLIAEKSTEWVRRRPIQSQKES